MNLFDSWEKARQVDYGGSEATLERLTTHHFKGTQNMKSISKDPRRVVLIPTAEICRDRQAWHVRVVIDDVEVEKLANVIRMTGEIDPITVVQFPGGYLLGLGLLRLLAAERAGYDSIPAHVEEEADPLTLVQRQLADDEASTRYRTLERAWGLVQLHDLLEERGVHPAQKEICKRRNLDAGTVSNALKAGRAITEQRVRQVASDHGLDWRSVAALPREAVRQIANASDEVRDELLHVVCGALNRDENPARAIEATLPLIQRSSTSNAMGRCSRLIQSLLDWCVRLMRAARAAVSPTQQFLRTHTSFIRKPSWGSRRARVRERWSDNSIPGAGACDGEIGRAD
jgi:ParB-like chromosome segregation protein Spo0J